MMHGLKNPLETISHVLQNALCLGDCLERDTKGQAGIMGHRVVYALITAGVIFTVIYRTFSLCRTIFKASFPSSQTGSIPPRPLIRKAITEKTGEEQHQHIPQPLKAPSIPNVSDSWDVARKNLAANLHAVIEAQRSKKTYLRPELVLLLDDKVNLPVPVASLHPRTTLFSEKATFYGYNAEGIQDYGWGCAWRAIQTSLSVYNITLTFEVLFHLFGPLENLQLIYRNKYPKEELSSPKPFAPYDVSSGWADPFVGEMVMHFYDIPSRLEIVNGIPDTSPIPHSVFHHKTLGFDAFITLAIKHFFDNLNPAPLIIDDGRFTFNIIGVEREDLNTALWIGDPHINEGVNRSLSQSPAGLYKIILDHQGKQISCSLDCEDKSQRLGLRNDGTSAEKLHFHEKGWVVLFPEGIP